LPFRSFFTPIGKTLLERLGQVFKTGSRQSGFILVGVDLADPEGLTLLNVLQSFRSIRIDLARSLQLAEELERLINQTNRASRLSSSRQPPKHPAAS